MTHEQREPEKRDPLSIACEHVGRFLYEFSVVEESLDNAIAKLFDLSSDAAAILTANIDFSRKVSIVHSIATLQGAEKPKEWASVDDLFKRIRGINDPHRQTLAHSRFEPTETGGVRFKRIKARSELTREEPEWTPTTFASHYRDLAKIAVELKKVVDELRPYVPSLDFSDPRNSGYIPILFDDL